MRSRPAFGVEQTDVFYNLPPENIYYPRNDSYSYLRLFPNVRLTYKLDDRTDISAFYNRRIDRPGEPELRIFPKYDDPELLKVGNPYLRPQDTESVEASVKTDWSTGTISTALYHRMIDNPFQRVFTIDFDQCHLRHRQSHLHQCRACDEHRLGAAADPGSERFSGAFG